VIRDGAFQPKPEKPAIGEVQMHLLAQATFGPDAEAVADDQHPDHQLRVDRGATRVAVKGLPVRALSPLAHHPTVLPARRTESALHAGSNADFFNDIRHELTLAHCHEADIHRLGAA
jgi:hypothetical protein